MRRRDLETMAIFVRRCLLFIICYLLFSPAGAQGLPLIRNYTSAEYGGHNRCFDIVTAEDGRVVVANFEGLLYYDRARWHIIHTPDISRVTALYQDSNHTVWVGGYNYYGRLIRQADGQLTMQQTDVTDDVKERLRQRSDEEQGQLDNITQTETLDGGLLVKVRKNNGLLVTDHDGRELYTITEANGLCSDQVARVAYDGHGVLWGATSHGIFAIELPSVFSYFLPKDGLAGEVHAIMAFDDKMYVGTTNGLYSIAGRRCQRVDEIKNICWTMSRKGDNLLVASSSGIYKVAPGGHVSRLTSNATTAMLVDGDRVYAGEPNGVYCYEGSRVEQVDDLPLVTDIGIAADGRLWLKNVHGQTKGTPTATTDSPLAALSPHLRTPLSHIEVKSQYRQGDQVWLGGDEVLAVVDAGHEGLTALNDCRTLRFRSIEKGSDERHLHFYYALDYAPLSGHTLYRYKLNSNKWSAWTEKQDVEFLNLPYGSYTLSIQARLANGELSDVVGTDFSIPYPLYMRWYMVVLYFLLFAYIVYLLFRYRLKRLQKDKIKLERIVEERTADLRSAQHELIRQEKMATVGKLTEGLIDRILNPMNYIINFSKMSNDLLKDLKENIDHNKDNIEPDDYEDTLDVLDMLTENLQNVDQYGQNTTRTLKAMEEMLKDRTGGYVETDLLPVLKQNEEMVNTYFAKEKEQYGIRVAFSLPDGPMPLHGNPDMLSKTFMSLLGNAVYAVVKKAQRTSYAPEVSLTATVVDDRYVLKIRDNGVGIEEKILSKIFDPFFTTKTTAEAAGVGLYLSREIVQNHGGDISVASVKDEFTEFTVTLFKLNIKD